MTQDEIIRAIDTLNRLHINYSGNSIETDFIDKKIKELIAKLV